MWGYHGKILFLNLTTGHHRVWEPGEDWFRIHGGGGLLGAALLLQHTKAGLDAFSPDAMLIFASSIIAGNAAPGLARFSVICKSPLSGGISESRGEGPFGVALKASGFDAIAITGRSDVPVGIVIQNGAVSISKAPQLWGCTPLETCRHCADEWNLPAGNVAAIGVAGERLVRYADIVCGDGNHAARLGTGAVMGSKNLKYLAISPDCRPQAADPAALEEISRDFADRMVKNTLSMWQKEWPGFSAAADLSDPDTAYIGYRNYQTDLSVASSEYTRSKYLPYCRGDNPCPGCPNDCMKYIGAGDLPLEETCIHQEVTGAIGPNLGIDSLETVLSANTLCNRYGLDSVSLGVTLGFVMECREQGLLSPEDCGGLDLRFGNAEATLEAIEQIAHRDGFGKAMGEGVRRLSAQLGKATEPLAMHVKGVEMVSFEPRTQTNLALGYAVAPYGPRYDVCEHDWDFDVQSGWNHTLEHARTLGILRRVPMEQLSREKVRNFHELYTLWKACDTLNLCIFASAPTRVYSMEDISKLIAAVTGWETSSYEWMQYGLRANTLMRVYNLREGLGAEEDILPARFFEEPVQFGRLAGVKLDREKFVQMRNLWYGICGWDQAGVPLESTMVALHLSASQ